MNRVRIQNTSRYPTAIVKILVRFAKGARECGDVAVNVKNSSSPYRGMAYNYMPSQSKRTGSCLVTVRVGKPELFPMTGRYPGLATAPEIPLADWQEAMVFIAAHELTHARQYRRREPASEIEAERSALQTLIRFREARASLGVDAIAAAPVIAAPSPPPRAPEPAPAPIVAKAALPSPPRPSVVDARRAKAAADLARWTRKLKLATTKVRKLRRRVRYYERAAGDAEVRGDRLVIT